MDSFRAATGRAEATRRVLAALDRAGFREVVAPGLDAPEGLGRALERLVPRGVRLPQRLAVVSRSPADPERDVLALVVHDGAARALEVELPAVVAEALGSVGASGLALTLRTLEPARAVLLAHGLDPLHADRFIEEPRPLREGQGGEGPLAPLAATASTAAPATGPALEPAQLERVILGLLGRLRFRAYGTRTPGEVAARLASRLGSALPAVAGRVQAARADLEKLSLAAASGSPGALEGLAGAAGIPAGSLAGLAALVGSLEKLGLKPAALELAAGPEGAGEGSARAPFPGTRLEPAWRLDSLGAGRVAWGGAFDLRAGRAAVAGLALSGLATGVGVEPGATQVLVVPVSEAELAAAHALAREARAAGLRVELDPSGRNLRSALRAASRQGVSLVAILGEREVREGTVLVKDLAREEQRSVPRGGAVAELGRVLAAGEATAAGGAPAPAEGSGA